MADTTTEGLNPEFQASLMALIAASNGAIWINSGYRSVERQQQLWDAKLAEFNGNVEEARKYVAPPGHSNHNFGLAADLGGDLKLAHQLAPQFGLSFPMDWEPWHIEPPWARQERGADYKHSQTTPPVGRVADDTPYGSLGHQLQVFQALIRGEDVSRWDATGSAASGDLTSGLGAAGGESGAGAGAGGGATPSALYQALVAAGLDPVHAAAFVAVAGRESGYRPDAHNGDASTGDNSYGLFQINLLGGMHSQYSPEMLTTLEGSAKAAAEMYQTGGTHPWGPYKGVSWLSGTDKYWQTAADASGGQVSVQQISDLMDEGL